MSDERISDEELAWCINRKELPDNVGRVFRELQQRRAADKYQRAGHLDTCKRGTSGGMDEYEGPIVRTPCTCGYDQLPEWLRGGG